MHSLRTADIFPVVASLKYVCCSQANDDRFVPTKIAMPPPTNVFLSSHIAIVFVSGARGLQGPEGRRGRRGRPGYIGKSGKRGPPGERGPQGPRGRPGKAFAGNTSKLIEDIGSEN